jgi:hypothetical protein
LLVLELGKPLAGVTSALCERLGHVLCTWAPPHF